MKGNENIGASRVVALAAPHICEVKIAHHEKAEEHGPHDDADKREDHAVAPGSLMPRSFATSRMWAMRDAGMPDLRQLKTVEGGASRDCASLVIPPNAATTVSYCVSICECMR